MEWVLIGVAFVLAVPAAFFMALNAGSRSKTNENAIADANRLIRQLSAQLESLQAKFDALRKDLNLPAEPAVETPKPVVTPPVAPPVTAATSIPGEVRRAETPKEDFGKPRQGLPPKRAADPKTLEEAFTSRWLVWLGALAIGLAGTFFVRYAIENGFLGPFARVTLGFIAGIALAIAGEWLRRRPLQRAIAAVRSNQVPPALTASGLFTAFVSIYAAYGLYHLLSPMTAFVSLAIVALLGVGLSLLHGRFVAFMGLFGAFVAPALIETPNPSAWSLFAYLLVVEIACLAVARYRYWWWFALTTLAGASVWPFLWLYTSKAHTSDVLPLGLYLILSVSGFFAMRRGIPEPEGQEKRAKEFEDFRMPEWVVWIAACTLAVILYIVVSSGDFNDVGLVLTGVMATLYLVIGRRFAILDSLGVVAGLLVLLVAWSMPVPHIAIVHSAFRPPSWVPEALHRFAWMSTIFGALFGAFGFGALWGAKRPALWAGVSAGVPILLLVNAYYRINDFGVDLTWALIALGMAALALAAAERVERYRAARGLEITLAFYAAGVVALVGLAAAMSVRQAWLTVALAIQLPALAWISTRIRAGSLQVIAGALVLTVLTRLVFNYNILSYPLSGSLASNWVIYGYGVPAISFLWAAHLFRAVKAQRLIALLEAAGYAFAVILVSLEIRLFAAGSIDAMRYELLEQSLQSISWLAIGSVLGLHYQRTGRAVSFYGSAALFGLATLQVIVLQLLVFNPMWNEAFVGNYPIANILLLAYAVPAAFAFVISNAIGKTKYARFGQYAAGAGFVLLFAYLSLEIARGFQGPIISAARSSAAEIYTYSVVWTIYALVLLALGIVLRKSLLRYASLAVLIVTVLKVFLSDMSGLTGLYRVASFLGLGLAMIGIGYVYQRFVFPRPEAEKTAA